MEENDNPRTPCEEHGHDFFGHDMEEGRTMRFVCLDCGEEFFEESWA